MADTVIFHSDNINDREYARLLELEFRECGLSSAYGIVSDDTRVAVGVSDCPDADFISMLERECASLYVLLFYRTAGDPVPERFVQIKRPVRMSRLRPYIKQICLSGNGDTDTLFGKHLAMSDKAAYFGDDRLQLSEKEFLLLRLLYENRGKPVSREEISKKVWYDRPDLKSNTPDVYINYLRNKIDVKYDTKLIVSVRGKGYMLKI